jgi:alpha-L-arabinofuranosidase
MLKSKICIDRNFVIGEIDKRLWGSFIEHLGRAIYTGIFEPDHPDADDNGFRKDVINLVNELGVPSIRYPGGNFVSGYDWEDGIGPSSKRQNRLDLAWRSIETNQFGLNEFMLWSRLVDTEPMLAVNLGNRGMIDAVNILEYCNYPEGTKYSDLRRSHGISDPYGIKTWCLGNEMDGPWQIGHKSSERYGELAHEVGHAMKLIDPSIELVAAGSSSPDMSTFPEWEATVLDRCYEEIDYISLHCYMDNIENDISNFLAKSVTMDAFIDTVISTCDYIKAKKRNKKQINISFDEWNVWFHSKGEEKRILKDEPWQIAPPLLEDIYTFEDALVVGCMINSLIRHVDRVKIGCLAQLVNVIAPIMTAPGGTSWRQTIFYPYFYAIQNATGQSMLVQVESPIYESKNYGEIPYLDVSVALNEDLGKLTIFAVNRSQEEELLLDANFGNIPKIEPNEHIYMSGYMLKAANTINQQTNVAPKKKLILKNSLNNNTLNIPLPPLSWNMITLDI